VYSIFTLKKCSSENLECRLGTIGIRAGTSKVNLCCTVITSQEGLDEEVRMQTAACFSSISIESFKTQTW
jgi:hypothetical protein